MVGCVLHRLRCVGEVGVGDATTGRFRSRRCCHALDCLLVDDGPAEPAVAGRGAALWGGEGWRHGAREVDRVPLVGPLLGDLRERTAHALCAVRVRVRRRPRASVQAGSTASSALCRRCDAVDGLEAGCAAVHAAASSRDVLGHGGHGRNGSAGFGAVGRWVAEGALCHGPRARMATEALRSLAVLRGGRAAAHHALRHRFADRGWARGVGAQGSGGGGIGEGRIRGLVAHKGRRGCERCGRTGGRRRSLGLHRGRRLASRVRGGGGGAGGGRGSEDLQRQRQRQRLCSYRIGEGPPALAEHVCAEMLEGGGGLKITGRCACTALPGRSLQCVVWNGYVSKFRA